MKTLRFGFIGLLASLTTAVVQAQTVQYLLVQWGHQNIQTDATTVADASATPYLFRASIQGTSGSPLTGTTFSAGTNLGLTGGSSSPDLTFSGNSNAEWVYEPTAYATQNALLTAFPTSGTNNYSFHLASTSLTTINGVSLPTTVTLAAVPDLSTAIVNTPMLTLTGGTWQPNGTYLVNSVSSPVTIAFNSVYASAPGGTDPFHFDISVAGPSTVSLTGGASSGFVNYDPSTSSAAPATISTLTIAAGQLIDGNTYTLEASYDQILSSDGTVLGSSAFAAAIAEQLTHLTLVTPLAAVPEPATFALLGGLLALVGTMAWRRRQMA